MQVNSTNKSSGQVQFQSLNKIRCISNGRLVNCKRGDFYISKLCGELKSLASKHQFFKENDVNAIIKFHEEKGGTIKFYYRQAMESNKLIDKIKNLFKPKNTFVIREMRTCPYDSTYFLARRLRRAQDIPNFLEA